MLNALVQLARVKALEIGALPAIHVQDLDVVPRLDEIAFRRRRLHPQVQDRVGQRVGQVIVAHHPRRWPAAPAASPASPYPAPRAPSAGPGPQTTSQPSSSAASSARAPAGVSAPNSRSPPALRQIDPPLRQPLPQPQQAGLTRCQHRLQPLGRRVATCPRIAASIRPSLARRDNLDRLAALVIDQHQPVARHHLQQHRPGTRDDMPFLPMVAREALRGQDPAGPRRAGKDGRIG